jgi:GAF domain-containing protein
MNLRAKVADRYRALLQVNNIALTKSTAEELFTGMCHVMKKLMSYDRAGLSIYDPDHDNLQIVALCGTHQSGIFRLGHVLDRTGSQSGWSFEHQAHMIRRDLVEEVRFASDKLTIEEGYRSLCSVPLVVLGNSIGVVTIASKRKNGFSVDHARMLQDLSNQVALALNATNPRCPIHANTRLVCPRCIGAVGGKATVSRHREDLSSWGKKGGRGRKKTGQMPNAN